MKDKENLEVIIIGGSFSGLSAAMALGRALRNTLIIDSGTACNRFSPHSHNFITHDGSKPSEISQNAKAQLNAYESIRFQKGLVIELSQIEKGFRLKTANGEEFTSKKVLLATGLKDNLPKIDGLRDCWGKSLIHCPYCHGYEVKNAKTGILANGDIAFHYAQLISNWTNELFIITNGPSTLSDEQRQKLANNNIPILEQKVSQIHHKEGKLEEVSFIDGTSIELKAIYTRPEFEQQFLLAEDLEVELDEHGLIKVDPLKRTNIKGLYACGDNSSPLRSVAFAVAAGNIAGAAINNDFTEEEF